MPSDKIEKEIVLKAARSKVWRALADAKQFGAWFGVAIDGEFAPGKAVLGRITAKGYEGFVMEMQIEAIEPEHRFAYRWHPYAVNPKVDYRAEPTTLVELLLDEVPGGTRLRVIESGFDRVPAHRRDEAFRMNTGGWEMQTQNLARFVETDPR